MLTLEDAVGRIRSRTRVEPRAVLILGGGMESLADAVSVDAAFSTTELLGRGDGSAESASKRLLVGWLDDLPVAVMQGALHRHEGYPLAEATSPLRVMRLLGAAGAPPPVLLLTGACESLHPLSKAGELALLDDHINFMGENPLTGPNLDALGPRFPDLSEPYDRELQQVLGEAALERRIPLRRGVYVAVAGPQLPTRAEYRMLRWLGGDFTGYWIVPEVIVARHMGMPVLAVLVVTAARHPEARDPADPATASRAVSNARSEIGTLLRAVCDRLRNAVDATGS
jgi:purine-nucleoside phosphorylase